jgi:hypothetical protein
VYRIAIANISVLSIFIDRSGKINDPCWEMFFLLMFPFRPFPALLKIVGKYADVLSGSGAVIQNE